MLLSKQARQPVDSILDRSMHEVRSRIALMFLNFGSRADFS